MGTPENSLSLSNPFINPTSSLFSCIVLTDTSALFFPCFLLRHMLRPYGSIYPQIMIWVLGFLLSSTKIYQFETCGVVGRLADGIYFSLGSSEGSSPGTQPAQRWRGWAKLLVRRAWRRRVRPVALPLTVLHPWQSNPSLPTQVTIDLSNHFPKRLRCLVGWGVLQRNDRTLIIAPGRCLVGLDSAQYGMLWARRGGQPENLNSLHYFASPAESVRT